MQNKRKILFWCLVLLAVLCAVIVVKTKFSDNDRGKVYEEMQEDNKVSEETDIEEEDTEEEIVEIPIDFAGLQQKNKDIYAWIRIPGAKVDYPIVQHEEDDAYYLNHTVEGRKGLPGSIYTETLNRKNFSDRNTVIYGHNMKNGTMFGDLSLYKNSTYMKEHAQIIVYTTEHIYTYQVFAAITYDNRHLMYAFDFVREDGVQKFLDSLKSVRNMSSYIDESVEVTATDRLLTLSTCTGNDRQRFLVGAVLVNEQ